MRSSQIGYYNTKKLPFFLLQEEDWEILRLEFEDEEIDDESNAEQAAEAWALREEERRRRRRLLD